MELFHHSEQSSRRGHDQGQSLVETAFGMIVIVIIMSGLLDLGRLWYAYTILEDAVGEGALYMAINPYCSDSNNTDATHNCNNPYNVSWRVRESSKGLVKLDDPLRTRITTDIYQIDNPELYEPGETVYVQIQHDIDLYTPLIQGIAGGKALTLTVSASQSIVTVP